MQSTRSLRSPRLAGFCLVGALAVAAAGPLGAIDFVVTKVADTAGSCEVDDCSLREAILAANAIFGQDHVTIPAGAYILSIPGKDEDGGLTGDLDITDDVVIEGAGASVTVVSANQVDRVFEVRDGIVVEISGLDIQGGRLLSNENGGGGFIIGLSELTLVDCVVDANTTEWKGGGIRVAGGSLNLDETHVVGNSGVRGGGIYVDQGGSLTLTDSTVEGNEAVGGTGFSYGGGIWLSSATNASLIRSEVRDNTAAEGGGLLIGGGTTTITDTTLSGNTAGNGGGLFYHQGTTTIVGSTLSGNTADNGGAVYQEYGTSGSLTLENSTISGNHAIDWGGAIFQEIGASDLILTSSTISSNTAGEEISLSLQEPITATNIIIEGCCLGPDFATATGNIESPGDTCGLGAGNQVGVSAASLNLGPLADHGGPTATHLPFSGSVAIDGASGCPPPTEDQRGLTRPVDGDGTDGAACDVGSVEVQAVEMFIFADGFESGDTSSWS